MSATDSNTPNPIIGPRATPVSLVDQKMRSLVQRAVQDGIDEAQRAIDEARSLAYGVLTHPQQSGDVLCATAKQWLDRYGHDGRDRFIEEQYRAAETPNGGKD